MDTKSSVVLLSLLLSYLSAADTRHVTASELKDKWPLTIPAGEVECRTGQVLMFRDKKRIYALNGTAKMKMPKLLDIEAIWKPDPRIPGAKINIGPLMDEARKLCR